MYSKGRAFRTIIPLLFIAIPGLSWSESGDRQSLWAQYQKIQDNLNDNAYHVPIYVQSQVREDLRTTEIFGIVDQPFETLAKALADPANWCEIVTLTPNIKLCTYKRRDGQTRLTLYTGPTYNDWSYKIFKFNYRYRREDMDGDYFSALLTTGRGPLGTRDYRIQLEAMAVEDASFVRLRGRYRPSRRSKAVTASYLATFGRYKVGFSTVGVDQAGEPVYVKGIRGIVERNAMRYYLALKAFADTQHANASERFQTRIKYWVDLAMAYPRQFDGLDKKKYLEAKSWERENQLNLQDNL